jgi:hypothetical protein
MRSQLWFYSHRPVTPRMKNNTCNHFCRISIFIFFQFSSISLEDHHWQSKRKMTVPPRSRRTVKERVRNGQKWANAFEKSAIYRRTRCTPADERIPNYLFRTTRDVRNAYSNRRSERHGSFGTSSSECVRLLAYSAFVDRWRFFRTRSFTVCLDLGLFRILYKRLNFIFL